MTWYNSNDYSFSTISNSDDNITMMDNLIETLNGINGISQKEIQYFMNFVKDNEYDSDSIFIDATPSNILSSNIINTLQLQFAKTLSEYFEYHKCMLSAI